MVICAFENPRSIPSFLATQRLRKNLKAPASSRIMSLLKGEIRRRKKCSEHLKELDRRTDYTDICRWMKGQRNRRMK
jgi:hypothetical protein